MGTHSLTPERLVKQHRYNSVQLSSYPSLLLGLHSRRRNLKFSRHVPKLIERDGFGQIYNIPKQLRVVSMDFPDNFKSRICSEVGRDSSRMSGHALGGSPRSLSMQESARTSVKLRDHLTHETPPMGLFTGFWGDLVARTRDISGAEIPCTLLFLRKAREICVCRSKDHIKR